ncbi:MAG TPA: hypothetical protein DEV98_02870 [Clostridiales bacterium]|nr:hypothetical protein [Clostridiales bacterium]
MPSGATKKVEYLCFFLDKCIIKGYTDRIMMGILKRLPCTCLLSIPPFSSPVFVSVTVSKNPQFHF